MDTTDGRCKALHVVGAKSVPLRSRLAATASLHSFAPPLPTARGAAGAPFSFQKETKLRPKTRVVGQPPQSGGS